MSQSFLSTLFILSHSILFPSHSPSSPILFSFTFFPSVYYSITHPFPSSLLSILLASCPNPSSFYSLLILSLSSTVFIIYVSSVFIHLYPYHLLSSSNLLDCSIDWTAQPLAFNTGQRKIIIIIIVIIIMMMMIVIIIIIIIMMMMIMIMIW